MFSYAIVETVLAAKLGWKPEDLPAFAARLRHLRSLGIPRRKPGTGKRLFYSIDDVQHMLVALLLEAIGSAPRLSVHVVRSLVQQGHGTALPDLLAVLPEGRILPTTGDRLLMLIRNQPVVAILNLRRAFADLEESLRKASK